MLLANLSKRQIAQLEKQYKQYVMCDFTEILFQSQFCSLGSLISKPGKLPPLSRRNKSRQLRMTSLRLDSL